MTLLELNAIVEGKTVDNTVKFKEYKENENLVENTVSFLKILHMNEKALKAFTHTESEAEFYKAYKEAKEFVKDTTDVFYTAKLGYFYEGVPARLTYLIQKAAKTYDGPNNVVAALAHSLEMRAFCGKDCIGKNVTIKSVVESFVGMKYRSIEKGMYAVRFKDFFEVYVENVDKVLLLPEDYERYLRNEDDVVTVEYVDNLGVCMHGEPMRTFNGRLGITEDDFDLRRCS